MHRTVHFKTAEPGVDIRREGDPEIPGGEALAQKLRAGVERAAQSVSVVSQHEYYGWSFEVIFEAITVQCVLNAAVDECDFTIELDSLLPFVVASAPYSACIRRVRRRVRCLVAATSRGQRCHVVVTSNRRPSDQPGVAESASQLGPEIIRVFLMSLLKALVRIVFFGLGAIVAWSLGSLLIRLRWPAKIPHQFAFEHELASDKKLREIVELLAAKFQGPVPGNVFCLGPVRGTAARLLFHSGPKNRRGNIYRLDYLLQVRRLAARRISLVLGTNRPYSYLRIRHSEVEPLVEALRQSFGGITSL